MSFLRKYWLLLLCVVGSAHSQTLHVKNELDKSINVAVRGADLGKSDKGGERLSPRPAIRFSVEPKKTGTIYLDVISSITIENITNSKTKKPLQTGILYQRYIGVYSERKNQVISLTVTTDRDGQYVLKAS